MNTKKLIPGLLCFATIGTMAVGLGGCNNNEVVNDDTLLWYIFGDKPADHDIVMKEANKIIQEKIGMKLDLQYIDSASYQEKMKLKMAAGEEFDLCFTGYNNPYQSVVSMGGLYDITELLDKVNMDEVLPKFYFDVATVDGKIYGVPNVQVVSNPVCIFMDKNLALELGIDLTMIEKAALNIKTLDDVKTYAALLDDLFAKVHKARPDKYVYNPSCNLITEPIYEHLLGDTVIKRDGSSIKLENYCDSEIWQYGVEKVREWYTKGYIRNDIASKGTALISNEEYRQILVSSGTWKPGGDAGIKERHGYYPEFVLLHQPYVGRVSPLATMTSVGANSENPEKAVEFLKLINSDKELYNTICWGIEDKHYIKNEYGKIAEIDNSGYTGIGVDAWKYGNQFNSLLTEEQEDNVWTETEKMNNEAVKSPLLGFVPKTDMISTELANIASIQNEYRAKISYGTEDSSVYMEEYRKKLEQAGNKKVLEELQKQYDEFLLNK